jgi:adenosyl cobinamide kinase/adenosyl cobinamide phosphate guanylyltransferase
MNLYIIGGAARCGKSILAKRLLEEQGVPYFSIDMLGSALRMASGDKRDPSAEETKAAEQTKDFESSARREWPVMEALFRDTALHGSAYCYEGESLLPQKIASLERTLEQERRKRQARPAFSGESLTERVYVRACFLGANSLTAAEYTQRTIDYAQQMSVPYDWTRNNQKSDMNEMAQKRIEYSEWLRNECQKHEVTYIDTSSDFDSKMDEAMQYLIADKKS